MPPHGRQGESVRETLLVLERYRGPARSANGGYVSGALAHELGDTFGRAVTVELRQPPPLEATMHVVAEDARLSLTFGGAQVATASYADAEVEPVEGVSWEQAGAASATYPGLRAHPFPTCFVCGTERTDGLQIFPGEVPAARDGRTRVAAPWTPDGSLSADWHEYDESAPRACLAATWAALDCVGGWAGDLGARLMVLGRMTAVVDDLPVVGEPHVVVGEWRGSEGRRTFTAATLQDADGRIVGRAEHTWVAVDPARFNG
jgi:hypothetical protein